MALTCQVDHRAEEVFGSRSISVVSRKCESRFKGKWMVLFLLYLIKRKFLISFNILFCRNGLPAQINKLEFI